MSRKQTVVFGTESLMQIPMRQLFFSFSGGVPERTSRPPLIGNHWLNSWAAFLQTESRGINEYEAFWKVVRISWSRSRSCFWAV